MSEADRPVAPRKVIPFYGAGDRRLFEIERRCMDRDGKVIAWLDELLPDGLVLDVGAGDGFTAERLARPGRSVVPLEPAAGMIARERRLPWVRGVAQGNRRSEARPSPAPTPPGPTSSRRSGTARPG